jgi:hypothetical protein
MLKYFADRGGAEHGGSSLFWPGTQDGFPFRGDVAPNLKQAETEEIGLSLDFHSELFCLWDPDQKAAFDNVMDRIVNGWYMLREQEKIWDETHKHYRVWLQWAQIYGEMPTGKHPAGGTTNRSGSNGANQTTTVVPGAAAVNPAAPRLAL